MSGEIPRLRNIMQGLHALESGQLTWKGDLAHTLIDARHERVGRTSDEVIEGFKKYVRRKERERELERAVGQAVICSVSV